MKAKLTEAQVRKIRTLKGVLPASAVAIRYAITPASVYNIWDGRTWRHK